MEKRSYWRESFRRLKQRRAVVIGCILLVLLVLGAIFIPLFSPYTYAKIHLPLRNLPPSSRFWFGTDDLGRDLLTRVFVGARISLFIGFTAALIDLIIGAFYGAIAAWRGGILDEGMMRLADILYSIPYLLTVILLMVVVGPGLLSILLALTFTGWVPMARLVRGQILQLKEMDYVTAARSLGASSSYIVARHLIPNAMGPILTTLTFTIPTAIFAEAFLSFLGLGVQPPMASWGTLASDGVAALGYYPHRLFFPALCICLTTLSFNLVGDGLRDAFDPRLRA